MNDLINRQDAIKWLDRWEGYLDEDMILRMKVGLKRDVPSAERTGEWIERHPMRYDGKFVGADTDIIPDTRIRHLYCGECDKQMPIFEKFPYCPYCGARMVNAWNEKELI